METETKEIHPDVEFHVTDGYGNDATVTTNLNEANALVVESCLHRGGKAILDVVIWSEDGARAFGGDDAVDRYREDPDASVFERVKFTADFVGRVR